MPTFNLINVNNLIDVNHEDWPHGQYPRHLLIGHADPEVEPPYFRGQYHESESPVHWHVHCPLGNGEILSDKLPQWSLDACNPFDSPYMAFPPELGHIEPGWCTMAPNPVYIYRWKVEGATIQSQWVASGGCMILYEIAQIGLWDLLTEEGFFDPSAPGVYEVAYGSDGWGESYTSWLEVLPGPVHPDDIPEDW